MNLKKISLLSLSTIALISPISLVISCDTKKEEEKPVTTPETTNPGTSTENKPQPTPGDKVEVKPEEETTKIIGNETFKVQNYQFDSGNQTIDSSTSKIITNSVEEIAKVKELFAQYFNCKVEEVDKVLESKKPKAFGFVIKVVEGEAKIQELKQDGSKGITKIVSVNQDFEFSFIYNTVTNEYDLNGWEIISIDKTPFQIKRTVWLSKEQVEIKNSTTTV